MESMTTAAAAVVVDASALVGSSPQIASEGRRASRQVQKCGRSPSTRCSGGWPSLPDRCNCWGRCEGSTFRMLGWARSTQGPEEHLREDPLWHFLRHVRQRRWDISRCAACILQQPSKGYTWADQRHPNTFSQNWADLCMYSQRRLSGPSMDTLWSFATTVPEALDKAYTTDAIKRAFEVTGVVTAEGLRAFQAGTTRDPSSPRHILSLNRAFRSASQSGAELIVSSLEEWSQLMDRGWVDDDEYREALSGTEVVSAFPCRAGVWRLPN
jgi:hypothetical protein